jgi:hypothetical protein
MDKIVIHTRRPTAEKALIPTETPFDKRYGFYGIVTEIHPKRNTVNLRMDTGRDINDVRVASLQWITLDRNKDYLTGQRRLPPLNSYVYCLMPSGEPSSAIILCSVFPTADSNYDAFKEDSPDAAFIDKRIDSGGWKFTHDIRTGTRKIQNSPEDGKETISIEVNQEDKGNEKVTVKIHKNVYSVDKENGIQIETDKNMDRKIGVNSTETVKGNKEEKITGKYKLESADTDIESIAPVGLNLGLYKTGLSPYLTAETAAAAALGQAAAQAASQLAALDSLSGGTGFISALGAAIIAFCTAMVNADSAAHTSIAKAVK